MMMKSEYETVCAEAEEALRGFAIHLPLSWMVGLILEYAETGLIDPDELQDMAQHIHLALDERVSKE